MWRHVVERPFFDPRQQAGGRRARARARRAAATVAASAPPRVEVVTERLGGEIDALWMRRPGQQLDPEEATQLAALRRLASILGVHFLEEEGDDLVEIVRRVAAERGVHYIFVGTPDERRWVEITRGSLLSRMVRELPGIDSASSPTAH